jgi:predicted phage tail component-like protein
MYDFIDTTEQAAGNNLPAEAVSINGVYIEDEIEGYKTLYTSGRESLGKEIESYDNTAADGSLTKYSRFPARTITVGFQLLAETPEGFRDAFNTLNEILSAEDAEIIFADETDKFFTGSPIFDAEIEAGRLSVTGEYQIYCADPFKYSVDEYEPDAVYTEESDTGLAQTFLINYEGTHPAYPKYTAEFYNPDGETDEDNAELDGTDMTESLNGAGACKFVAFMDDEKHVLQFGNPELADESETPAPLVLTNRSFKKSGSYDASKSGEEWVSPATGTSTASKYKLQGSIGTGAAIYGKSQLTLEKNQSLLAATAGTDCKYTATVTRVDGRTASKVTLHIQVKQTSLKEDISKGATLTVEVTYGSKSVTKVLKSSGTSWSKGKSHSCSFTMTVSASQNAKELSGIKIKVTRKNGTYKSGGKTKTASGSAGKLSSKTCRVIVIPAYIPVGVNQYCVKPTSYGSAVSGYFTGPSLTWTYPASGLPDTDDGIGADCFDLSWQMKFCMGKTTNETQQMGAFECLVLTGDSMDQDGKITNQSVLAGFKVVKTNTSSKGKLYLYANGVLSRTEQADLTWKKGWFGNKNGFTSCRISKSGSEIVLLCSDPSNRKLLEFFKTDASSKAFKVVFGFYRYGARPAFDWNCINSVKLVKKYHSGDSELDSEPFQATQVLVADSATGEVTLDGLSRPDLGALGNDWEQMCLVPGVNEITTAFSQRAAAAVKVMRRCREDEAYQGAGVYNTDDEGTSLDIAADDPEVKIYFTCSETLSADVFFYQSETTDSDGKRHVTASEHEFIEASPAADEFDSAPTAYFVLEDPVPKFSITYREVFL